MKIVSSLVAALALAAVASLMPVDAANARLLWLGLRRCSRAGP